MSLFELDFFQNIKFQWDFIKRTKKTKNLKISRIKCNLINRISKNIYKVSFLKNYFLNVK